MKYALDKYPKGSYKGQRDDGRYIDGYLLENIKALARNIVNDMTFLGVVYSSTLEVGTGKSVFAQHFAEAYLDQVKQIHGIDNSLTIDNVVFRPKDLIERSFKIPKYSVIILDEWEDAHYWSELAVSLRDFFRKCRQLNLLMLIIIPNFFQLPSSYAINRSVFAVDVKFEGEFQRGFFSFYNYERKKELYVKGKKFMNYHCVDANFSGRFLDGYPVGREVYLDAKYKAFADRENEVKPPTPEEIAIQIETKLSKKLKEIHNLTSEQIAHLFEVSRKTYYNRINKLSLDTTPNCSV